MRICPACSGSDFAEKTLTSHIISNECLTCGLFLSTISHADVVEAEFARINAEAYRASVGVVRQQQARQVLKLVGEFSGDGGTWLDIGCGFGYFLDEARRTGFDVFGVEPDTTAFTHAASLLGADRVRHGSMNDATVTDASAAVVSTLDVLEHIPVDELSGFARLVHRKLKGEGLWVIKLPSSEGLYFKIAHLLLPIAPFPVTNAVKRLWQSEYEFPHTVYFNRRALELFLCKNGFEVVDARFIEDIPDDTVIDRLLMDDTIPKWQAYLSAPVLYLINAVERRRGVTDALLLLARRV